MDKKNYERPVMGIETFVPNQFIAQCTPEINEKYVVDPDALVQGVHVKYDSGQDKMYTSTDHAADPHTSDHSIHEGAELYFIGMGWGREQQHGQLKDWPEPDLTLEQMAAHDIHYFYLFAQTNNVVQDGQLIGGVHVWGGTKIEEIIVNMS